MGCSYLFEIVITLVFQVLRCRQDFQDSPAWVSKHRYPPGTQIVPEGTDCTLVFQVFRRRPPRYLGTLKVPTVPLHFRFCAVARLGT